MPHIKDELLMEVRCTAPFGYGACGKIIYYSKYEVTVGYYQSDYIRCPSCNNKIAVPSVCKPNTYQRK